MGMMTIDDKQNLDLDNNDIEAENGEQTQQQMQNGLNRDKEI